MTLRLRGETVVGAEQPGLGYCRRGIIELVEGKTPDEALPILERTCSLAHEAYRMAFCQALEAVAQARISQPARTTRVVFAEVERLLARLWTLAQAARVANVAPLYRLALDQRESLFAALEDATGERHYWAVAVPGGVRDDLELQPLQEALTALEAGVAVWQTSVAPNGLLGRAGKGIGAISADQTRDLDLTGLAARGSRMTDDLRLSQPYAAYEDYEEQLAQGGEGQRTGDVASRLARAVADLATSRAVALAALANLPDGAHEPPVTLAKPEADRVTAGAVEGPHGLMTARFFWTSENTIHELKLYTPGMGQIVAMPELLEGRLLPQIPLILASLDLCIECLDQ